MNIISKENFERIANRKNTTVHKIDGSVFLVNTKNKFFRYAKPLQNGKFEYDVLNANQYELALKTQTLH